MHTTDNYDTALAWVENRSHATTYPAIDVAGSGILDEARVRDADGNPPSSPTYRPTWNLPYAVSLVFEMKAEALAADPTGRVTSFTSEGSSVSREGGATAESLSALARRWMKKATGATGLSMIELGGGSSHPLPRSAHHGVTINTTDRGSHAH